MPRVSVNDMLLAWILDQRADIRQELDMGPVYATRLVIWPDANHDVADLHRSVVEVCFHWLREVASTYETDIPDDFLADVQVENRVLGTRFTLEHLIVDGEQAWRAVAIHPFDSLFIQMRIELQARHDDGEETVTVRLLLGSTRDCVRPLTLPLRRPRIITALLDEFQPSVSSGNKRATRYVKTLQEDQVEDLCKDILHSVRGVPIIVVSRNELGDLVCPQETIDDVALQIAGLGRVYVLPSFLSSYRLTDYLGKELSCFNGAVRIYWPDFTINDSPHSHHVWPAARLVDQKENLAARLPGIIFSLVSAASAIGIGSDAKTWNIYRSAQDARTQEIIERRDELARQKIDATETDYRDAVGQVDELRGKLDENEAAFDRLVQENGEMERAFKAEIYELKAKDMSQSHMLEIEKATGSDSVLEQVQSITTATTVERAIAIMARIANHEHIVFLPSCYESAKAGQFGNGMDIVWRNLFVVYWASRRFHDDPTATLAGVMFESGATNEQFKSDTSDSARRTYPHLYQKKYWKNGREEIVEMRPHFSNGKGNAQRSLFIYWHVDNDARVFVVGHVGVKLRDSSGGYG